MFESIIVPMAIAIIGSSSISSLVIFFFTRKDNKDVHREKIEELMEFKEDAERKISDLSGGQIALLHNSIFQSSSDYLARGYITIHELDNLKKLYKAYHELGGNGTGDIIMAKVDQLEIRED